MKRVPFWVTVVVVALFLLLAAARALHDIQHDPERWQRIRHHHQEQPVIPQPGTQRHHTSAAQGSYWSEPFGTPATLEIAHHTSSNYLSSVKGFRWRHFPIRIWFDWTWNTHPDLKRLVLNGFGEWVDATDGQVSYQEVPAGARRDADVSYTARQRSCWTEEDAEHGRMNHTWTYLALDSEPGIRDSRVLFQTAAAHEFGHVLGIIGHSPHSSDLMYLYTEHYKKPGARDLATLRAIYHWTPPPAQQGRDTE